MSGSKKKSDLTVLTYYMHSKTKTVLYACRIDLSDSIDTNFTPMRPRIRELLVIEFWNVPRDTWTTAQPEGMERQIDINSIQLQISLIQLKSALIELESSPIELESSLFKLQSSPIQLDTSNPITELSICVQLESSPI